MTHHVFARVAGFGLTVIPYAPFCIEYADDLPTAIDIIYESPIGQLFARLIPDGRGYQSKLDQYTRSLDDVVDIQKGPDIDFWRIETSHYTCSWPQGFAVCSNNFPQDPGVFDFRGRHHELISIQHPQRVPEVTQLRAPNQTVVDVQSTPESEWIKLTYLHEGVPWVQRHEVVRLRGRRLVVTMQSPSQVAQGAATAASMVAHSIQPCEEPA